MSTLRRQLRRHIPAPLRIALALGRRTLADSLAPTQPRFASRSEEGHDWPPFVSITQPIKPGPYWEGKLANIGLGAALLDRTVIPPGETFSFWRLIGRPSASAGFRMGRSIRDDAVGGDIGGGLCQVSGIAYEAGLRAGLRVVERFAHSRDLYAEDQRFAPLGLDATVVWPWKDLRLKNLHEFPVQLRMVVSEASITASVHARQTARACDLEIRREDHPSHRRVRIVRRDSDAREHLISDDTYTIETG